MPAADLTLTFAEHAETGELRHVLEGPTGSRCGCICPGCRQPLEAVNAENESPKHRPHFRHTSGLPADAACAAGARVFAFAETLRGAAIALPPEPPDEHAGLFSAPVTPAQSAAPTVVRDVKMLDFVQALLTLSDGRQLVVHCVSTFTVDRKNKVRKHDLEVLVPDDILDQVGSSEDLRKRLTLDSSIWRWCRYQTGEDLLTQAATVQPGAAPDRVFRPTAAPTVIDLADEPVSVWTETTNWKNGDCFETTFARYRSGATVTVASHKVKSG